MKKNIIKHSLFVLTLVVGIAGCQKEENYDPIRPATPTDLMVTKGDTSVFLNWQPVDDATSYLVVRGLDIIAENIQTPNFVDHFGPDTLVEYRLYAVNKQGWRSYRYASDSGYVAIPDGVLPRAPVISASDADNYKNCTVSWQGGRFAKSFNVYRGDELIVENFIGDAYVDVEAPVTPVEYRVSSVNRNGVSTTFSSDMGNKGYFFIDTYESDAVGFIMAPWTFRDPSAVGYGIAYYTEGDPTVTAVDAFGGSAQSLKILDGKAQLLCDWGGVPARGKYKISVKVKKTTGGFWMVPDFSEAQRIEATGKWETFEIETGVIDAGTKFNLKIEPDKDGDSAFIDDWSFEYITP